MVIGIFSQWWVRTRYPRWFTKYKCVIFIDLAICLSHNHSVTSYILAAALDGGTQVISFILSFVSIELHKNKLFINRAQYRPCLVPPVLRTPSLIGGAMVSIPALYPCLARKADSCLADLNLSADRCVLPAN